MHRVDTEIGNFGIERDAGGDRSSPPGTGSRWVSRMTIKGSATLQDLLNTPKDGKKYELVDGEIVVSPAGMRHSEVAGNIFGLIWEFVQKNPIGKVYVGDVGIAFPNGNVRSPDVTYVSNAKLPGGLSPEAFGELIPDLAVEVLSPSDRLKELGRKIGEFLDNGVPIVWLVDPSRQTVTIYRSLTETQQLTSKDTLTAEPVLPGFSVSISRFF
jgi:Uma2 family endonuclease